MSVPRIVVVMGVSGSGKTTVGELLAARLGWDFEEGDSLHPAANVAKMAAGHPLTDADRWPWLRLIGEWMDRELADHRSGVVTCSALKRSYRDLLREGRPAVSFLCLGGTKATIQDRLTHRHGHFMPPSLLDSQFGALEPLAADEPGVTVDVAGTPAEILAASLRALRIEQEER